MVILSGLLLVLSFPPFPFAFLIYFAFIPLLLVIDETPPRTFEDKFWGFFKAILVLSWRFLSLQFIWRFREKPWIYRWHIISHNAEVFRYTYTAFVIWNVGCCYWLLFTGMESGNMSEPFVYFAAGLVALLLNPFLMSLPVYFYTKVRDASRGWLGGLGFVSFWVAYEWLHYHWDLAWPWLTLGHSMSFYPLAVQYAEFTGVLGISAHILLVNMLLYYAIRAMRHARWAGWLLGILASMVVAAPFALNFYLLNPEREVFQPSGQLNVRLIQPNISSIRKQQTQPIEEQVELFVKLSRQQGLDSVDLLVLPEKALYKPVFVNCLHLRGATLPLVELVQLDTVSLLTGAVELRYLPPEGEVPLTARPYAPHPMTRLPCYPQQAGYIARYNSAFLLNPTGTLSSSAQKSRLVPMAEQLPFVGALQRMLAPNARPGWLADDFTPADSLRLLYVKDSIPLAPLICYESLFAAHSRKLVQAGGRLLVVLTDDGFWKVSASQIQHAHFARLRAIESRRTLLRAANTGISCYIDVWGNMPLATGLDEMGVLDVRVPLYEAETFYVKEGDYVGTYSALLAAGMLLLVLLRWSIRQLMQKRARPGRNSA